MDGFLEQHIILFGSNSSDSLANNLSVVDESKHKLLIQIKHFG